MTTVEIKEKHTADKPKPDKETPLTEKENMKIIDNDIDSVKKDADKDETVINDGLIMKDKLINNVSSLLYMYCLFAYCGL